MDGGGHSHLRQAAADELQHRHLRCGVLHGHAIGPQPQVGAAAIDLLVVGIVEVAVHNLFCQSEWTVQPGGGNKKILLRQKNVRFDMSLLKMVEGNRLKSNIYTTKMKC